MSPLDGRGHRNDLAFDAGRALATLNPAAEEDAARALAQRRLRSMTKLEPHVATRRLLGMLARKGYPSDVSLRVVRRV